jgi:hypothetical protein
MALNLSKLLNRDPDGYLETEIGRLAVFDLSQSGRRELEKASNKSTTGEDFTRLLARHTCFPLQQLRDGRFRPSQTVLTDDQLSALSRKSLEALAEVLLEKYFETNILGKSHESVDLLDKLMTCYKLQWLQSDQAIANALKASTGGDDRLEFINRQIRALPPITTILRPPQSTSDSTLVDIREVLLQMNNFAESSSKAASKESAKTGRLALWTLIITAIRLAGNPPVSRLICIIHVQSGGPQIPALTRLVNTSCGYNNFHDASPYHRTRQETAGSKSNRITPTTAVPRKDISNATQNPSDKARAIKNEQQRIRSLNDSKRTK